MKSIKDLSVRIIHPKSKKRGRPSKIEWCLSEMMSKMTDSKAFKDESKKCLTESMIYGRGIFDANKIFEELNK